MPRKKDPSYRHHKARNCAVVTITGHDHYLGAYDSDESWAQYHRLVAEYRARLRQPPPPVPSDAPLTVTELIAHYWRFAKSYYVKDDKPTSEIPRSSSRSGSCAASTVTRLERGPRSTFPRNGRASQTRRVRRHGFCRVRGRPLPKGRAPVRRVRDSIQAGLPTSEGLP
jgi:hypothetical protein